MRMTASTLTCYIVLRLDDHKCMFFLCVQVVYFGLCLPGFCAQFLPFMRKYKIQEVK